MHDTETHCGPQTESEYRQQQEEHPEQQQPRLVAVALIQKRGGKIQLRKTLWSDK